MMIDPSIANPAPDLIRGLSSVPRAAKPADATGCAAILQSWLVTTHWLPDLHSLKDTQQFVRNGLIAKCATHVTGLPVTGFISIAPDRDVAALYVDVDRDARNRGLGTALLNTAKATYPRLTLWVFQANTDAIRFYHRHGFTEVRRTQADNDEGLPDIRMAWHP